MSRSIKPRALMKLNDQNWFNSYNICPLVSFFLLLRCLWKISNVLHLIPFSWIHNETPQNSLLFKCLLIPFHVHMCFRLLLLRLVCFSILHKYKLQVSKTTYFLYETWDFSQSNVISWISKVFKLNQEIEVKNVFFS